MKRISAAAVLICAAGLAPIPSQSDEPATPAEVQQQARKTIETGCQNCHGVRGDSTSPTFPRLNGQPAEYLVNELKDFRDHKRTDPHAQAYMWGMAATLDDTQIDALAKYYSGQTPTAPQTGGALAAEGKKIFLEGAPAQNIPPCQACHGEHGEGNGQFPRLAGQHAGYLTTQLESFRTLLRENDIMHANTKDMTDTQIEAIVSYLAND